MLTGAVECRAPVEFLPARAPGNREARGAAPPAGAGAGDGRRESETGNAGLSQAPRTFRYCAASGKEARMDLNLVVLAGRLAAPPDIRQFGSGSRLARYLVTVRTEEPTRRVDVVPVTLWDPDDALVDADPAPGTRVWGAGGGPGRVWG